MELALRLIQGDPHQWSDSGASAPASRTVTAIAWANRAARSARRSAGALVRAGAVLAEDREGQRVPDKTDRTTGVGVYLADTADEAFCRLEPAHDERYKWFAPFGFVRYADEQGRPWGRPGAPARMPTLKDGVDQKAWLIGLPARVIEAIKEFEAKYPGCEQLMIQWAEGLSPNDLPRA